MRIQISCSDSCWQELAPSVNASFFQRVDGPDCFEASADAFVDFSGSEPAVPEGGKPYFYGSVVRTLGDFGNPAGVIRVNDWPGFLQQSRWEFSGKMTPHSMEVFSALGKDPVAVTDQPGFVSARIISMIINEAYFALDENISTKAEIDTAMKYGTNYPYGPFEWAGKIGIGRVYGLLHRLTGESARYVPAASLVKEARHVAHP